MRLAKAFSRLLIAVAFAFCVGHEVRAQAAPAAADKPAQKSHKSSSRSKSRTKSKAAANANAAPAAEPAAQPAAPAEGAEAAPAEPKAESIANKRDPFVPLVNTKKDQEFGHLPPGKAGLVIATVRVDGAVRSQGGMIAVVTNPEQRVYFIREGDHLYDGSVEKIGLDGVTFRETSKDAFGKPVERSVTKRIYPSAGEQQ